MEHADSLGSRSGSRIRRGHQTQEWEVFAITQQLTSLWKEFQEEMRLVAGQWCSGAARLRQGRRAVVRYLWHDAGRVGSAQNPSKEQTFGPSQWRFQA